MRRKISVISVVYNNPEVTLDLLKSLSEQEYRLLEIIIVDNGSTDDASFLKRRYPEIRLIRSEKNLGFAGGNNLGIQAAKGKYLLFLNNDTIVPRGTISRLLETFEAAPTAGILSPQIAYFDEPQVLQYGGASAINPWTGRNRAIGYRQQLRQIDKTTCTAFAHGAAMFTSKERVQKVGLLSESYFLYYEELDWSIRFQQAGYKVLVDFGSHVLHKESMTTGKSSTLKTYYMTRNRILFMRRHFGLVHKIAFFSFFAFVSYPKSVLKYLCQGQIAHLKASLAGIMWHFNKRSSWAN